ncbi:MAG: DUF3990 domain-containing protein [Bacteroidales bacterium]|jgi:hypothetical protein|nr:DUF3990 domain-containing protein [Bacteroidales bacterium]
MILYHGSNIEVMQPQIIEQARGLDFGRGFYTTSNYEQAKRFTENVVIRQKTGQRTISTYNVNEKELFSQCSVLQFNKPNKKWLDFVVKNRTAAYQGVSYDLVIGPVANDTVYNVINIYINGYISEKEAIRQLKVRKLFNQWTFCSQKSLSFLTFLNSEIIV